MSDANDRRPRDDPFALANTLWGRFLALRERPEVPPAVAEWTRLGPDGQRLVQAHLMFTAAAELRLLRRDLGRGLPGLHRVEGALRDMADVLDHLQPPSAEASASDDETPGTGEPSGVVEEVEADDGEG